jgi:hypothetical protein
LLIQIGSQYSAPVAFDVHDVIPKLEQPPTHLEAFSPSTIRATACADNPLKPKVQNLTLRCRLRTPAGRSTWQPVQVSRLPAT